MKHRRLEEPTLANIELRLRDIKDKIARAKNDGLIPEKKIHNNNNSSGGHHQYITMPRNQSSKRVVHQSYHMEDVDEDTTKNYIQMHREKKGRNNNNNNNDINEVTEYARNIRKVSSEQYIQRERMQKQQASQKISQHMITPVSAIEQKELKQLEKSVTQCLQVYEQTLTDEVAKLNDLFQEVVSKITQIHNQTVEKLEQKKLERLKSIEPNIDEFIRRTRAIKQKLGKQGSRKQSMNNTTHLLDPLEVNRVKKLAHNIKACLNPNQLIDYSKEYISSFIGNLERVCGKPKRGNSQPENQQNSESSEEEFEEEVLSREQKNSRQGYAESNPPPTANLYNQLSPRSQEQVRHKPSIVSIQNVNSRSQHHDQQHRNMIQLAAPPLPPPPIHKRIQQQPRILTKASSNPDIHCLKNLSIEKIVKNTEEQLQQQQLPQHRQKKRTEMSSSYNFMLNISSPRGANNNNSSSNLLNTSPRTDSVARSSNFLSNQSKIFENLERLRRSNGAIQDPEVSISSLKSKLQIGALGSDRSSGGNNGSRSKIFLDILNQQKEKYLQAKEELLL